MSATHDLPQATAPSPRRTNAPMPAQRQLIRARRLVPMHALLVVVAVVTAFPFYAMVMIAFQPGQAIVLPDSMFPETLSLAAFQDALNSQNIPQWALNSAIYSIVSVVIVLLFASMAGYAFAKKRFAGREVIFWVFIAMLMIPYHLTIIPQYLIVGQLNGLDTMWGMIAATIANAQAMFLMRQFIYSIPDEMLDAAKIDGASEFRVYWSIVLPQTKPIMATLGTFVFLWHWNDFLWPMISQQSPENYVLTVGLNTLQEQQVPLATMMAAAVVSFIPTLIIFILLQRYFVRGVMMSGMK
ncbi:carbohydrate ABC transporter permease [Ruania halotolerans]|uniref:carbohydrate ABC transporter permease n=1 Tax=Ruania halotolerans TaxID=2897773 RepID=UPI001E524195|nr:carbohydrate ABC transporter permease [Ruania halotolerans]UFU06897.1 carbohydrate ABC transporter permease [Ruania halotolerans]